MNFYVHAGKVYVINGTRTIWFFSVTPASALVVAVVNIPDSPPDGSVIIIVLLYDVVPLRGESCMALDPMLLELTPVHVMVIWNFGNITNEVFKISQLRSPPLHPYVDLGGLAATNYSRRCTLRHTLAED